MTNNRLPLSVRGKMSIWKKRIFYRPSSRLPLILLGWCLACWMSFSTLAAQKQPVLFGVSAGAAFYQPRIRLHQNAPLPGIEFKGVVQTGDGGKGNFIFEFGYLQSRIPEVRSFYSWRTGAWVQDAQCVNNHHYFTGAAWWRVPVAEEEKLALQAGLQVNTLFRVHSFCRYLVDSTRQQEWQGPFSLAARDRLYPVLITGADTRLWQNGKTRIYLYFNLFHQLYAFPLPGDKQYKDPLLSSRYFAPAMGWNVGMRVFLR